MRLALTGYASFAKVELIVETGVAARGAGGNDCNGVSRNYWSIKDLTGGGGNRTPVPTSKPPTNRPLPETGGAESGARSDGKPAGKPELPPELARLVKAWPELPPALRAGILAMVAAARGRES